MTFDEILEIAPYSLDREQKGKLLTDRLSDLTKKHMDSCLEYNKMLKAKGYDAEKIKSYTDIPFLPVRMFKELSLKSVPQEEVVKTMTSSGTTGQSVSKIYLDRTTSSNQQKTMVKIVNEFTGSSRMPMIILDCPSVIKDRAKFSARGAGILGFSIFGSKKIYALDDNMQLDVEALQEFLANYGDQPILLFGFTFMVWQHFYKELLRLKGEGITFDLSQGILIHGGGWKKLISEAVSQEEFHSRLKDVCGIDRIHDYYGMVEQTGCIYMQCECGHLHASIFSDVIARRPKDFSVCDFGEPGILQVVSTIPESYPGHSLLTEDEGVVLGEDDCPCGRLGKYFKINGRIAKAEIRGCSDTYAADHSAKGEKNSDITDKKIKYLVGDRSVLEKMTDVSPLKPFDDRTVEFLNAISKKLMSDAVGKRSADIITLGFWLRKASIMGLKDSHYPGEEKHLIGRGTVFHIAPSNVAVNYAYSLFTGLICGNANIVRLPSKDFPQVSVINRVINEVISEKEYEFFRDYICLVQYERDTEVNDMLSGLCDVRVIWGGDRTIAEIRKSPIPPRTTEITFADRYSLAVIDSDMYLSKDDKDRVVSDFYNDTYLSDQNACTSPRLIVWMGNEIQEAKKDFWTRLHEYTDKKYQFQTIQGVDKLVQFYLGAANYQSGDGKAEDIHIVDEKDNLLVRVAVDEVNSSLMDYRGNSGYFFEYDCNNIIDIREFCNNTHCQTIGLLGDEALIKPLLDTGIKGVDRIVPIGHTMDFDLVWDGYNLISCMTRQLNV